MPFADNHAADVGARADDFFGPAVQWQRRLWDVGFASSLTQLSEASDAVNRGVLSGKSVKWFALSLEAQAAKDPGAGDGQSLTRLRMLLKGDLTSGGTNHSELAYWAQEVEREYLPRWQAASGAPVEQSRVEDP